MRLTDLRVVEGSGMFIDLKADLRPATTADLVAALISEGGEIEEALVGDVEYHDEDGVQTFTVTTQLQPHDGPGRYLVFRIPEEE